MHTTSYMFWPTAGKKTPTYHTQNMHVMSPDKKSRQLHYFQRSATKIIPKTWNPLNGSMLKDVIGTRPYK